MNIHSMLAAILHYLIPLLLTVLCEAGAAFFFHFKKEEQHTLFLINFLTNPLLNLLLYCISLLSGRQASLSLVLTFELAVVIIEGLLLRKLLPMRQKPFLLSFVFNAASYLFGVILFAFFPAL